MSPVAESRQRTAGTIVAELPSTAVAASVQAEYHLREVLSEQVTEHSVVAQLQFRKYIFTMWLRSVFSELSGSLPRL